MKKEEEEDEEKEEEKEEVVEEDDEDEDEDEDDDEEEEEEEDIKPFIKEEGNFVRHPFLTRVVWSSESIPSEFSIAWCTGKGYVQSSYLSDEFHLKRNERIPKTMASKIRPAVTHPTTIPAMSSPSKPSSFGRFLVEFCEML